MALLLAVLAAGWAAGGFDFYAPAWLAGLLLLPAAAWLAIRGLSGLPSSVNLAALLVRSCVWLLLILCLAELQRVRTHKGVCALFVLDHSASIPEAIVEKELKYVNAAAAGRGPEDSAGIVVFGENASVELMPARDLKVDRLYSHVGRQYTDLQGAVELAAAAFPSDKRKKIVLITDGNENKGRLLDGIAQAAGHDIVTDILPVSYDYEKEVLVEKVTVPDKIKENETFDLRVHVLSRVACPAELSLYRNGVCVAREPLDLKAGRNSYTSSLKIETPGFYTFAARVSAVADTLPENNEASGYVYIQGASRVLFVAPTEREVGEVMRACREDNLEADFLPPDEFPDALGALQNYDCIVLANVPSDVFSAGQLAMIQANTRDLGVGLIMIGGENSFGAGGYENTPIEEALPVTMDIRQRKIMPKGALVLVLHTCEFADGNYWAKQITKKAIETVNAKDDVGVLMFGAGREEWLFELRPAGDKAFMYGKIDAATPGDMPSFEPTLRMAHKALFQSDAMVRHIIVISDGDPAGPPPQLIKDIADARITISTVAINPHSPRDVDIMKYLAYETKGRFYFATDPNALPGIFVKEAKVVKRSLIFNKQFQPILALSSELTKGIANAEIPPLMAYVATTPKPLALAPLISDNDNKDPILATWRYGLGKTAAFTSDATSNWGRYWIAWDKYKKFWTQLVRWTSRRREESHLVLHTEMDGSRGRLIVDAVDADGKFVNFLKLNGRLVNPDNQGAALAIRQTAPGRYEADFEARQAGVSLINIAYQNPRTGGQGFTAAGVSIPYSPEFRALESDLPRLRQAAAAGGGRLLSGQPEKDRVFDSTLPNIRSVQPVWKDLLTLAFLLFLLDVILRRIVINRADWAAAGVWVKTRLSFRKKQADRDPTVAALLQRKQKVFEQTPKPSVAAADFKQALDRAAETGQAEPVTPAVGPPAAETPTEKPPVAATASEPAASQESDSYTHRLLAAKKRAQKGGSAPENRKP